MAQKGPSLRSEYLHGSKDSKSHFGLLCFLKKWAKPGLFLVYFRPFLNTMTMFDYKKHRWFAWDLNLGRQDGRRRGIH